MGVDYKRYDADRKRGGSDFIFYNKNPDPDTKTYSPTWPEAVASDATLGGIGFVSRLTSRNGGNGLICVDFERELTAGEETALETLYNNHTAPQDI